MPKRRGMLLTQLPLVSFHISGGNFSTMLRLISGFILPFQFHSPQKRMLFPVYAVNWLQKKLYIGKIKTAKLRKVMHLILLSVTLTDAFIKVTTQSTKKERWTSWWVPCTIIAHITYYSYRHRFTMMMQPSGAGSNKLHSSSSHLNTDLHFYKETPSQASKWKRAVY